MRKLFFTLLIVFAAGSNAFTQNRPDAVCPAIDITGPSGGNYAVGMEYDIAVMVHTADLEKLNYEWTLSNDVSFEGQGKPLISFTAREELNDTELKASVKIKGLPENCPNAASASFLIRFKHDPPLIADYGKVSFAEEKAHLNEIVSELKNYPDGTALFLIFYTNEETAQTLKARVSRIENYLVQNKKLSEKSFTFVFAASVNHSTKVYFVPAKTFSEDYDWRKKLEEISFQKSPARKN